MEVQDRRQACLSGRYINPGWWDSTFEKREQTHEAIRGATSSGAFLKLQIASDADRLDLLAKKLTIGVVAVVITDQQPKAS